MAAETIRVRGQVQGVGFRPFVWRLAADHGILGTVRNDGDGVLIHAEGSSLDGFAADLIARAPSLARIDRIERTPAAVQTGLEAFSIIASAPGTARTRVAPDTVPCAACRAEIADPAERRYRYPFTNCTHCGPRFSIVRAVPYDRAATTMAPFVMCKACRSEYEDPADRRFHAQPIACPACGPHAVLEVAGCAVPGDPIEEAAGMLRDGAILAVKGIGGFHLCCDALNEDAVARLRARKRRPAKPFALMAADLPTIRNHAATSREAEALLASAEGPIVLLPAAGLPVAPSVAPGQWTVGFMLPTSPLHALLTADFGGPLVMTSGNRSGEPQAIGNDEARETLGPFVDGFLIHDREIARRLDDPVAMTVAGAPCVLRRARGYAPVPLPLPAGLADAPPVLACGAHLKATICLTRDGEALLSHHLGDLDDPLTAEEFEKAARDYRTLLDHRPAAIAADLHPNYRSTAHAEAHAAALSVPLVRVQHHHAHIAAVMAENGWRAGDGPVIGVAVDGLGLGDDGTVWGGEFLLADYAGYRRLAHLKEVSLPGGDAAQTEPWRNLLAQLDAAGQPDASDRLLAGRPIALLRSAIAQGLNAPMATSTGRLFDAVAAAIGLAPDRQTFEGEAAMLLESRARLEPAAPPYPFARSGKTLDPAPMWSALLEDLAIGAAPCRIAARFHAGLAAAVADLARDLAREHGAGAIALSGGVFQNATLLAATLEHLSGERVLVHRLTPPNDGAIAFGQAAVATAHLLGL